MSEHFEYNMNAYFGVFYPESRIDLVHEILKSTKFKEFAKDENEVTIGDDLFCISTNSDKHDGVTMGFIFVDEMAFNGKTFSSPEMVMLDLDHAKMDKAEARYHKAVSEITDLYSLLVREFKARKVPIKGLYHGWRAVSCAWDTRSDETASSSGTGSTTSSEPEVKVVVPKAPKVVAAVPKAPKITTPAPVVLTPAVSTNELTPESTPAQKATKRPKKVGAAAKK